MTRIVDFVVIFDDRLRKRHYHETIKGAKPGFERCITALKIVEYVTPLCFDGRHGTR